MRRRDKGQQNVLYIICVAGYPRRATKLTGILEPDLLGLVLHFAFVNGGHGTHVQAFGSSSFGALFFAIRVRCLCP